MTTTALGRRRRRLLALLAAVALLAVASLAGVPSPASADDEDFGYAEMKAFASPASAVYGDVIEVSGYLTDSSSSCFLAQDCDQPSGTITVYLVRNGVPGQQLLGTTTTVPDPSSDRSSDFSVKVGNLAPDASYYFSVTYTDGDFDDSTAFTNDVTVSKVPCSIGISQSAVASKPGVPVTFTADLGTRPIWAGRSITFTNLGDGTVQGAGTAALNPATGTMQASFTTSGLSQGITTLQASSAGDSNFLGCASPEIAHLVALDTPPVAVGDSASVLQNSQVSFNIFANDSDDNGIDRGEIIDPPFNGELEFDEDTGDVTYTPEADFAGDDGFEYLLYDGIGQSSNIARVNIFVECDSQPVDDAFTVTTTPWTSPLYALLDNDAYCETSTPEVRDQPAHGTVTLGQVGSFTYAAAPGYVGTDSFTYGFVGSPAKATVTLTVDLPPPPTTTTTEPPTTTTTTTEPPTTTTTTEPPTTTTTTTEPPTTTTTTEPPTTTTTTEPPTTTTTEPPTTTTTTTTEPPTTTTEPPTTTTTTTTTVPPTPTAAEATVVGWYGTLLGRAPDPAGLDHWAAKLDAGTRPLQVTRQIVGSGEFGRRIVREAYRSCLGRSPDAGGLAFWSGRIARGASVDDLRVGLLASGEAWRQAGADPAAWAGQVYDALMGRLPRSAERSEVVSRLRAGERRAVIAREVATSAEARRAIAGTWYRLLLGRAPSTAEAAAWAEAMDAGTPERTLVAELASTVIAASS